MTEMLSDIDELKKLDVKPGKELNLLLKHEGKLVSFLKRLKKSIGEDLYKSLYPQGSQPGIMYGSPKIHKPIINGFPKAYFACSLIYGIFRCRLFAYQRPS